jgi:hypothetical protein
MPEELLLGEAGLLDYLHEQWPLDRPSVPWNRHRPWQSISPHQRVVGALTDNPEARVLQSADDLLGSKRADPLGQRLSNVN